MLRGEGAVRSDDILRDDRHRPDAPNAGMAPEQVPLRSYMAVPVFSATGDVFGGMLFGHPEPAMFSERSERVAVALAEHASTAVENALLDERAQLESSARTRVEAELIQSERQYR
jgi:GAF domain-containing protein